MSTYEQVILWSSVLMVMLEIMIVLILIYDTGLHQLWNAFIRKQRRSWHRKFKKSTHRRSSGK